LAIILFSASDTRMTATLRLYAVPAPSQELHGFHTTTSSTAYSPQGRLPFCSQRSNASFTAFSPRRQAQAPVGPIATREAGQHREISDNHRTSGSFPDRPFFSKSFADCYSPAPVTGRTPFLGHGFLGPFD
jgi:hypothetical protein